VAGQVETADEQEKQDDEDNGDDEEKSCVHEGTVLSCTD
jgi:hypothetical protein